MKLSKRLLSVVLTVAMLMTVIGVLPITASADTTYTVGTGSTVQAAGDYRSGWPDNDTYTFVNPTTLSASGGLDARTWVNLCPVGNEAVSNNGVTIAFDVTLPASNGVPVYYIYSGDQNVVGHNVFFGFAHDGSGGYRLLSKLANETDPYYNDTVYLAQTAIPVILYIQGDTFELYVDGEQIATVDTDVALGTRWYYSFYAENDNDTGMTIGNLQYLSGEVIESSDSGDPSGPTYYAGPFDFESSAVGDNVSTVASCWSSGSDFTVRELNGGKAAHVYRSGYTTIQMDLPGSCYDISALTANKFVYEFDLTVDKADSEWHFGTDNGNGSIQSQWVVDRYGRVHLYGTAHDENNFTISANTTYRFSWVVDVANDTQVVYVNGVQILSGALNGDMSALRTLKMQNTLEGWESAQDINFYMDNIAVYEYNLAQIESNAPASEEPSEAASEEPSEGPTEEVTEEPTAAPAFTADISVDSAYSGESFTVSGTTVGATDEVTVFVFGRAYTTNAVDNAYSTTITIPIAQAGGIYSVDVTDTNTLDSETLNLTVTQPSNYIYQNDFETCSTEAVSNNGNGASAFNTTYANSVGFLLKAFNYGDNNARNGIRTDVSGPDSSTKTFGQWGYSDDRESLIAFNTSVLTGDDLTSYNTADSLTYQFDIYFPSGSSERLEFRLGDDVANPKVGNGYNLNGAAILSFLPTYGNSGAPVYYFNNSASATSANFTLTNDTWYTVTLTVDGTSGTITHSASIVPQAGGEETVLYTDATVYNASSRGDLSIFTYRGGSDNQFRNVNWAMDNFSIEAPAPEEQVEIEYLRGIKHSDDLEAMAFITKVVIPATKTATLYMTVGRAEEFAFATNATGVTVQYAAYIDKIPADKRDVAITASVRAAVEGGDPVTSSVSKSWDTADDINNDQVVSDLDLSQAYQMMIANWKSSWSTN